MKIHIQWFLCLLVINNVHSITGAPGFEEYSPENVRFLTRLAYVVVGLSAASYIGCQLLKKNRLQRATVYLKAPMQQMFRNVTAAVPLLQYALVHKMIATL